MYEEKNKKGSTNKNLFQKEKSSRFWKRIFVFDIPGRLKYVLYDFVALKEFLQLNYCFCIHQNIDVFLTLPRRNCAAHLKKYMC